MKYSTLSFIISSSILLHACGSSNDIQNHTTDPKPNHNSQHQSNSHNINGNQSSNNSNQADNHQNSNHQQNNQNDFTPNISSGNAPNPKNNIIISANNHDDDNDAPIPAPPKINLDTLTPDKADELVKKAVDKLQKATIEKDAAKQKEDIAERAYKQAVDNLKDAAEDLGSADKSKLPIALQNFKTAKETVDKLANELASKMAKTKKAEQVEAMATLEKELADNAKKFVSDKTTEPEAVLDKIKAEQDAKQAVAEKKELEIKKELLESEAKVIAGTVEYLKDQNETIKNEVLDDSNVTPEAKKEAETKIKENEDKIAKLNKQNKEKTQAAKDLDNPIAKADVDVKSTDDDLKKAQEGIKYRGVYASDGKYDPSTSYKNVKKVIAAKPGGTPVKDDEWMQEWTLFIKDGDKEVKIDTSKLKGELRFPVGNRRGVVASFNKDKSNILVNRGGKYFIQGYIGKSNSDFFNVGLVTPEDKIPTDIVKYNSESVSANDAFLVTKDGADATRLIAKVSEAKADFGKKIFEGKFKDFKKYSIETNNGQIESSVYSGITDDSVEFRADIKGNKFMPAKDLEPNKAKVYGYFYGNGAKEAGGLVEHDKFYGTFGVRAD